MSESGNKIDREAEAQEIMEIFLNTASEDLTRQLTGLFSRVTGQDLHEAAKESMEVAMTFRKKRWLQQVHMAIEFNNNTFNRQLHKYRSKTKEAGHV